MGSVCHNRIHIVLPWFHAHHEAQDSQWCLGSTPNLHLVNRRVNRRSPLEHLVCQDASLEAEVSHSS